MEIKDLTTLAEKEAYLGGFKFALDACIDAMGQITDAMKDLRATVLALREREQPNASTGN